MVPERSQPFLSAERIPDFVGGLGELIRAEKRAAGQHAAHPFLRAAAVKKRRRSFLVRQGIKPVETGALRSSGGSAPDAQAAYATIRIDIEANMRGRFGPDDFLLK